MVAGGGYLLFSSTQRPANDVRRPDHRICSETIPIMVAMSGFDTDAHVQVLAPMRDGWPAAKTQETLHSRVPGVLTA